MTAVVQDELGGPEVLHLARVARPAPGIGHILVRVLAAGVNPIDAMSRQQGLFARPPFTLGYDVSGVVEAVGPGVTLYGPGDEVTGLLPFPHGAGAYAEFAVGPTRAFVPTPAELTHVEAAALPLAALTAWQALVETASVRPGTRLVIVGAAGGVGHLAVQIANARGAHTIAVASADQADRLRALGAAEVIDRHDVDYTAVVDDADVVFDTVGGDSARHGLAALRPGGILVTTLPQAVPDARPAATAAGVRLAGLFVESDRMGLTGLMDLVRAGRLRPTIAATYPLAEAATAHGTRHTPGKVVLTVGS